jgi:sulfide:quinone oxidoreductase
MLSVRSRLSSVVSKRSFATAAAETPKKQPTIDQKFKVVVVGGGPGGLSGKIREKYG